MLILLIYNLVIIDSKIGVIGMRYVKKILFSVLLMGAFIGFLGGNPLTSKAASNKHSINATTKVPLKYQILEPSKDNTHYKLASAKYAKSLKADGMVPAKKIATGAHIRIYCDPVIKHNGYKYYLVSFFDKKYEGLYKLQNRVFPTIAIKDFNQLKNVRRVK